MRGEAAHHPGMHELHVSVADISLGAPAAGRHQFAGGQSSFLAAAVHEQAGTPGVGAPTCRSAATFAAAAAWLLSDL